MMLVCKHTITLAENVQIVFVECCKSHMHILSLVGLKCTYRKTTVTTADVLTLECIHIWYSSI